MTYRVTNKCKQTVNYVAIGIDGFTGVTPTNGGTYTGNLGSYNVTWTDTAGSLGFASIEFQPTFRAFKSGASDVFSIVVTNFDPNVTIQVAGQAGISPEERYSFLLSQTSCLAGPTATATDTPTPGGSTPTNTPMPTATHKPTKTPRPH